MSTTLAPTFAAPVTSQDIRALKHADSVVFRLYQGQSTMEANRAGKNTHDGFDQKHTVYCAAGMTDYSADHSHVDGVGLERYTGFVMSASPQYDRTLLTLIGRIRPGDTVKLSWVRGNNSENDRGVGWSRDELRLVITNDKTKHETYLVDVRVGPDDTARMIQLAR